MAPIQGFSAQKDILPKYDSIGQFYQMLEKGESLLTPSLED